MVNCTSLDLLPKFDFSSLNISLQKLFENNRSMKIKNVLAKIIPSAFVPIVLELSNIDGDKVNHNITHEERIMLMKVLKNIPMHIGGLLGPENAIVSSGGLDPREVDWKTMRSRLFSNLYMTGDILDIDRPSGGYSLQLCWTTGYVAGSSAGKDITSSSFLTKGKTS